MARIALISDIHGNLAGLRCALSDIERRRCDEIVCLGDLVDGGPENDAVVQLIRALGIVTVQGNHDEWSDSLLSTESVEFLCGLPVTIHRGGMLFTHISPRKKKRKVNNPIEAWNVFDECDARIIVVGHLHIPFLFCEESFTQIAARELEIPYARPMLLNSHERYIISPGSLGYSRDAWDIMRYAIYDDKNDALEYHCVDGPVVRRQDRHPMIDQIFGSRARTWPA